MTTTCSLNNCSRPHHARGYCKRHYMRWRTHGDPAYTRPVRLCDVPDCGRLHYAHGHCRPHHDRLRRYGTLTSPSREGDEAAVQRAIRGDRPRRLFPREREQVVSALHRRGLPDGRIAQHLDITAAGVLRIRRRLGLPAITR